MRITNSMMITRSLRNQNSNLGNMNKWNHDLSTMVNIHRPSDDPIRVARTLRLESDINLNKQYSSNMNTAKSWLEKTEGSLQEINSVLQKMRELAVAGANGVLQTEDKQKIETEIAQMKEHLIQVGNDTYMGRHIFSGHQSDKAFLNKDGSYNENLGLLGLEYQYMDYKVGVSQDMTVNVTGDRVFGQSFKSAMIEGTPVGFVPNPTGQTGFNISMDISIEDPETSAITIIPTIVINDEYDNGDLVSIVRDLNSQIPDANKGQVAFAVDKDRIKIVTRDVNLRIDNFTEAVDLTAEPPISTLGFETIGPTPASGFEEAEQKLRPMIEVITDLQNKLFSGDGEGVSAILADIDDHITNILQIRGEVGSKVNTIDIMNARMDDTTLNLKDLLSKTRDTDVAETLMHLTSSEAVYRASLAVSARIIQPTLIDFLR